MPRSRAKPLRSCLVPEPSGADLLPEAGLLRQDRRPGAFRRIGRSPTAIPVRGFGFRKVPKNSSSSTVRKLRRLPPAICRVPLTGVRPRRDPKRTAPITIPYPENPPSLSIPETSSPFAPVRPRLRNLKPPLGRAPIYGRSERDITGMSVCVAGSGAISRENGTYPFRGFHEIFPIPTVP